MRALTRRELVAIAVLGAFLVTLANFGLLSKIGWGAVCDEPASGPGGELDGSFTAAWCRRHGPLFGGLSELDEPEPAEWGCWIGPPVAILAGAVFAVWRRRVLTLVAAFAIAVAWGLWGWLPPALDYWRSSDQFAPDPDQPDWVGTAAIELRNKRYAELARCKLIGPRRELVEVGSATLTCFVRDRSGRVSHCDVAVQSVPEAPGVLLNSVRCVPA
jgi:hypothetical protein